MLTGLALWFVLTLCFTLLAFLGTSFTEPGSKEVGHSISQHFVVGMLGAAVVYGVRLARGRGDMEDQDALASACALLVLIVAVGVVAALGRAILVRLREKK